MPESTPIDEQVSGAEQPRANEAFTRRATGLVREVSPFSTFVFNLIPSLPSFVLAISVFVALGLPGASLYGAYWIAFVVAAVIAIAFGMFSSAVPRSGGDYVLVGRTLHPSIGMASSFCMCASSILSAAFLALAVSTVGIGPGFSAIGLVAKSHTLMDWGATIQSSHGWQFGIGILSLVLITAVLAGGWRVTLLFQNVGTTIAMAGLAIVGIILAFKTQSGFVHDFNGLVRPILHRADSYHYLIKTAHANGLSHTATTLGKTLPAVGIVMAFSLFSWWSIHIAGEVRRANTWQVPGAMVLATFTTMAILTIFTAIFFHAFGHEFFAALNALNGTPNYPFASPPFYMFLATIATGSPVVGALLEMSFVAGLLVVLYIQLVQPSRALFAFAFDGVLPQRVAHVSAKRHVPVESTVIILALSVGALAWAVWGASFLTVLAYAVLFLLLSMTLLAFSAAILPYRRPDVWRGSATQKAVVGVPVITIAGVLALAGIGLAWYLFLHYPALGITHGGPALRDVGIVAACGVLVFYVASAVRRRQTGGSGLAGLQAEIPPE